MNRAPSAGPRRHVHLLSTAACVAALVASAPALAQQQPVPVSVSVPVSVASPSPSAAAPARAGQFPGVPMGYVDTRPRAAAPLRYAPYAGGGAAATEPDAASSEEPASRSAAFDVGVVAELPIMIGGQLTLELPYRFLLQGEVGVLPAAAINAVDGALVSAGAYDQNTSTLIRSGLANSLVVRASGGWRPFPDHGFEVMGGYTLATFGGGLSAKTAVEAAAGITVPTQLADVQIPMHSTIHNVHVSLGWRWVVAEHFIVRASIAYLQSVSSSSHIDLPAGVTADATTLARLAQVNQIIDTKMNDAYTKYVKMPVLGLSLGYRF